MLTDIEIARNTKLEKITKIAEKIGLNEDDIELYGKYKAKIAKEAIKKIQKNKDGKLILVTAINPTPAGEGKTTTSIGLAQALQKLNKKTILALREPSLGPCFGVKGGAAGGGYSQVAPMEDINLHFTGDFHAITSAHNLVSAMIDNHIYHGNQLNIKQVVWKRVVDLNDRALRNVIVGVGDSAGEIREDGFMITVASEIMAVFCLAENLEDLKDKIGKIIIAYDKNGKIITINDIQATGSICALLKDAIKPNLVQSLEGVPAIIHGGPFANIAHGCNSVIATKTALKLCDYVVTEAGFGADLGAEKFLDIKCRKANLKPDCVVIVATCRSLKYNGGVSLKDDLKAENLEALAKGIENLNRHIENIKKYGLPVVVALNKFDFDSKNEIDLIKENCKKIGARFALSNVFMEGGNGGIELANEVLNSIDEDKNNFHYLYDEKLSIKDKIKTIATEIYRAGKVEYSSKANKEIKKLTELGFDKLPICIAKTQYSFSDNPKLLCAPTDYTFTINEVRISAGAGFIVCLAGDIMTMPGLAKEPAAIHIDIDENENIVGLF